MARRPYFQKSITELESEFEAKKQSVAVLSELSKELGHRTTERAKALAAQVRTELARIDDLEKSEVDPGAWRPEPVRSHAHTNLGEASTAFQDKPGGKAPRARKPEISNTPKDILNAWISLEVLSPQGFRREADLAAGDTRKIAYINTGQLPWEIGERSMPKKRLYYEVILGTINLGPAVERLLEVYSDNRPDAPKLNRQSPIASLLIDQEGFPLDEDNSLVISSFAWGIPIALQGDLKRLASWRVEERRIVRNLRTTQFERDRFGRMLPLTSKAIKNLHDALAETLHLGGHDIKEPYFAIRKYQYFADRNPPEPSLLNSFYLEDLDLAQRLDESSQMPNALKHYLAQSKPANKVSVLDDNDRLRELLQPSNMPLGRWPGPGRFPLALLQQAAVNGTASAAADTGILAVNGPPGTGKTTLLRDVVAARIVERANVMTRIDDPARVFSPTFETVQRSGAKITMHKLDDRLKGFEIVVASSNNKAVENVSAELPARAAIASDAAELRYFSSISDHVLDQETWGLVSAVLGNSTNRYNFSQKFWRDGERGLSTYLNHAAGSRKFSTKPKADGLHEKKLCEVVLSERPPENRREAIQRWKEARSRFQEATQIADAKRQVLQNIHDQIIKLVKLIEAKNELECKLPSLVSDLQNRVNQRAQAVNDDRAHRLSLTSAQGVLADHQRLRPGFFARLFRTRLAKSWNIENKTLRTNVERAAAAVERTTMMLMRIVEECRSAQDIISSAQSDLAHLASDVDCLRETIGNIRKKRTAPIPDPEFFQQPHEIIQISALWLDHEDHLERDNVFQASMDVHRAFIDVAADPIRQNLALLTETFGTRSFGSSAKDSHILDLWATFFLVVPVVSTTFASVRRMFSRLPCESFGWLLIDEAGQALPQAAVGAILRSKRTMVVGDPLQVEPVVTLPNSLTEGICAYFGVDPLRFNAPDASVQTLADAASPYCARFPSGSGHRDVGLPLLVHRRCDSPMFDISNDLAYSNLMVQAKAPSTIEPTLGRSSWIDVVGEPGPDKWCADEAAVLLALLKKLRAGGGQPDLYIVTPFVIVQDNLRKEIGKSGVLNGWVDNPSQWVFEHVGTVHTVQGREAKIVFFVLGAQGSSQNGARAWAGGKPNLVNVAVTRAQTALHVIGNRGLWKSAGVFATLDRYLPSSDGPQI